MLSMIGKQLVFILFFLTVTGAAFGQQLLVMDASDDQPISEVQVVIHHPLRTSILVTSSLGTIKSPYLLQFDSLEISRVGYLPVGIGYADVVKQDYTIYLTPQTSVFEPVEIRGMVDSEEGHDPPIRIERIRPAEIRFQNPQTSADMVGMNGRLFIQKSQMGGGSPMIRGFAANNVLIVVDGVRMNNAIFRQGNLQNIITIDPLMIRETEVFYGPGSVIYGSDALGGVMSFQTLNPEIRDSGYYKGNIMLRTSSANKENSWHVDLSYGKGAFADLSSISLNNYSNLKMGNNGPEEYTRPFYSEFDGFNDSVVLSDDPNVQYFSGYTQINVNQKLRYKPNDRNDLIFHFGFTTSSPIPRYDRLIQTRNGNLRYGDWFYGSQKWLQSNLRYKLNFREGGLADKMVITAAYQKFQESRNDRELYSKYMNIRTEDVKAYTLNADFDRKLGSWDLMYGLEAVFNRVFSDAYQTHLDTGNQLPISTRYPDGSSWYTGGAYFSLQREASNRMSYSIGARYSWMGLDATFQQSFIPFTKVQLRKSALNGSLGVSYKMNQHVRVFANASSGFRAPNIDDIGKLFEAEEGKIVVPNPNLLPEYSYSSEAGLNLEWGKTLQLQLSGYYTVVDNIIIRDNFTLDGQDSLMFEGNLLRIQALQNSDYGTIYGGEIQARWRLTAFAELSTVYNVIAGQTADGDPIRHVTPNFGSTSFTYRYRRFKADLYANYHAELPFERFANSEQGKTYLYAKDANGHPYSPAWQTLNLKTAYFFSESLNVNIGLENLFNVRYRPYSSGISAPGRNLILSIYGRF
ncbi:MAG: TonB-dependent receptor [Bacteroidetes bacterium]|nr:TonB-dependent receptor [Bacteroidota bacterium]